MFTSSHRSSAAPEPNAGHLALGDARQTSAEAHAIDGRARKVSRERQLRQQRNHFRHLPAALAPHFRIATASARAEPRRDAAKRLTTRRRPCWSRSASRAVNVTRGTCSVRSLRTLDRQPRARCTGVVPPPSVQRSAASGPPSSSTGVVPPPSVPCPCTVNRQPSTVLRVVVAKADTEPSQAFRARVVQQTRCVATERDTRRALHSRGGILLVHSSNSHLR